MAKFDTNQRILYDRMEVVNDFQIDPGVCVLPVAEEPPTSQSELASWSPVVVLRLHAPYRLRRSNRVAEKKNNPPLSASPRDEGKFVFVGGNVTVGNTMNASTRNFDWVVTTDYLHVENCVNRVEDGFVLGASPWTWQATAANAISQGGGYSPSSGAIFGGTPPTVGAISGAGSEALVGWQMGTQINFSSLWVYNEPSYLPGVFFSDNLVNSGHA